MHRFLLLFLALIPSSVFAQLPAATPEEVSVSSQHLAHLSAYLRELVDGEQVSGGVVMLARHGKVALHEAVGMMDREAKKAMRKDAIFRIASMTKPIICVATLMLIEDGKIQMDDLLSKYIPEFKDPKVFVNADPLETISARREISIRDLLCHTSGLTYPGHEQLGPLYNEAGITIGTMIEEKTLEEMMRLLAGLPLAFHPGDRWHYGMSNDVLGRVIEVASGMPLDRFLENRIFVPLGMTDTCFRVPCEKMERITGLYYFSEDGELQRLQDGMRGFDSVAHSPFAPDFPYNNRHRYRSGGGGLCSTAEDYMRFCLMLLNDGSFNGNRLLTSNSVRQMRTNQLGSRTKPFDKAPGWDDQSVGFGFGVLVVRDDPDRKQLNGSFQWYGGYSTSFSVVPQKDWAIVVMLQTAWNDNTLSWAEEFKRRAAVAVME